MINFNDSFNWLGVLKDLKAGMPINSKEHMKLMQLAGKWPTCACGQLCQGLPRFSKRSYVGPEGAPRDDQLRYQGVYFSACIDDGDWGEALKTFHQIEERTREVLGQLEE